jgi:hypothetical protein
MGKIVRSAVTPLAAAAFHGDRGAFTAQTTENKGVHLRIVGNLLFVALLVCSSLLLTQRTNAADFIRFDVPGSTCTALFPQCTTAIAISPQGIVTGSYADANGALHSYLRTSDGAFITFDPPGSACPTPSTCSSPSGINSAGTISGIYCDTAACHGFLRASNGTIGTFDPPGSVTIIAVSGPNPSGAVTGSYTDASHIVHGFLRAGDGTFSTFDAQGSIITMPTSIDPGGTIAGSLTDINSGTHGFLRSGNGAITTFDPPGSIGTSPSDINSAGVITGSYLSTDLLHHYGFLRSPDSIVITFTAADSSLQTIPKAINAAGVIAGFYQIGDILHGFVRGVDGGIVTFGPLGAISTVPQGIDPVGTITGYYTDSGNLKHGFIRIP